MYKIIGVDGKEYGPASLDQLKEWISQGRVNAHTLIQPGGSADWKAAGEIPEIRALLASSVPTTVSDLPVPPTLGANAPAMAPRQGLSITSFVLGIASFALCLGVLTGIPAIICGHAAKKRARRSPGQYGGAGLATAGFILGCLSAVYTILIVAMLLPVIGNPRKHGQLVLCNSRMKQIGLALRVWGMDHQGQFPFNVSTNAGGTMEFCRTAADGFDPSAPMHLSVIGKELMSTTALVCPSDGSKKLAASFAELKAENLSYLLRTGPEVTDTNLAEILLKCPVHGTLLRCDGSVDVKVQGRRLRL